MVSVQLHGMACVKQKEFQVCGTSSWKGRKALVVLSKRGSQAFVFSDSVRCAVISSDFCDITVINNNRPTMAGWENRKTPQYRIPPVLPLSIHTTACRRLTTVRTCVWNGCGLMSCCRVLPPPTFSGSARTEVYRAVDSKVRYLYGIPSAHFIEQAEKERKTLSRVCLDLIRTSN